ncbi:MAG: hypothetical protein K0B84_11745 [Firmicutes bacterium]|nr:hypothetical protein [Bacillota bacterium]
MKKFVAIMILLVTVLFAGAQEKLISHRMFGARAAYEVTLTNDTVAFTPQYTITGYALEADTNLVINLNTTKASPGNIVWFEIKGDATKRYVKFDTNIMGAGTTDSLNIDKTRLWGFVFVDNKFVQINRSAEY